jgi:hypothetical protein
MDAKYLGIMLHGLGTHKRASTESDKNGFIRDGVKYLHERFFNNLNLNLIRIVLKCVPKYLILLPAQQEF